MQKSEFRSQLGENELKEFLYYEPDTGNFYWKKAPSNRVKVGDIAGSVMSHGYRTIGFKGKEYLAHRLAFLFVEGVIPDEVDHKNGDPSDNSWNNLRKATRSENNQNTRIPKNNKSGSKNVYYRKDRDTYSVSLMVNGKTIRLGCYEDKELADLVAIEAREKYHKQFANHS